MAFSIDDNRKVIPTSTRFETENKTLSGTDFHEISKPEGAHEVIVSSLSEFTIAESATGDGFPADYFQHGISKMANIYVKGADGQVLNIVWSIV